MAFRERQGCDVASRPSTLSVLATDVAAVYSDWGTPRQRAMALATPPWLRAQSFAGGSMGPKVEAVCRFVEATGKRAAIGQLEQLSGLIDGTAGTQIRADGSAV